ncbi:MAG: hypothetical protein QOJ16_1444 [Acidobacteriota bacterium]|nr:hypothetical protein [Acidobacteriota bacterium]
MKVTFHARKVFPETLKVTFHVSKVFPEPSKVTFEARKVYPEGSEVDPETFRKTFHDLWTPAESFPSLPESLPAEPEGAGESLDQDPA